jgi:hypothetical protein
MKEFLLIFRNEVARPDTMPSPEQIQAMMKPWQDWIGNLGASGNLSSAGNRLDSDGRVLKQGAVVTNGPFVEIKEAIGGYVIIKAKDMDEAAELAKDCPIFAMGGNVEVRTIVSMD